MQAPSDVFLTTSPRAYQKHVLHGQETVSIFIGNLHATFNDILRKNHGTLLYCGRSASLWQLASLSWGVFLNSVRPMGSTPISILTFEWSSVISRLNAHELLAFVYIFVECTLPRQSPIANRVLYKRQRKLIDVSDRRVMIFLTTYFRTTPMADVKLTSLVRHPDCV